MKRNTTRERQKQEKEKIRAKGEHQSAGPGFFRAFVQTKH